MEWSHYASTRSTYYVLVYTSYYVYERDHTRERQEDQEAGGVTLTSSPSRKVTNDSTADGAICDGGLT